MEEERERVKEWKMGQEREEDEWAKTRGKKRVGRFKQGERESEGRLWIIKKKEAEGWRRRVQ